jgi:hypothetical protein
MPLTPLGRALYWHDTTPSIDVEERRQHVNFINAYQRFYTVHLLRNVDLSQSTSVEFLPCDRSTVKYRYDTVMTEPARPFRSILVRYLDEIRRLRRGRHTWRAIAEHLTNNRGVKITASGVHVFFKRATRRKTLPLGFDDPVPASPSDGPRHARTPGEDEPSQRTTENQAISVMPINQHKKQPWFGSWEPEQGINYTPKE